MRGRVSAPPFAGVGNRLIRYVLGIGLGILLGLAPYLGAYPVPPFRPIFALFPDTIREPLLPVSAALSGILAAAVQWYQGESLVAGRLRRLFFRTLITAAAALLLFFVVHSLVVIRVPTYGDKSTIVLKGFVRPVKYPCLEQGMSDLDCLDLVTLDEGRIKVFYGAAQMQVAGMSLSLLYLLFTSCLGLMVGLILLKETALKESEISNAGLSEEVPVGVREQPPDGVYDVFLCHNNRDKEVIRKIATALKGRGLTPWLDEWELRPGLPWQTTLEQQIGSIKSAAVFVGEGGIGPWQRNELDAFLRQFVNRGCPVIPVLLLNAPSEPKLPVFLESMTWVDFRKRVPDPMDQLCWGITGRRRSDRKSSDAFSTAPGKTVEPDELWQMYVALHKTFEKTGGNVWTPEIGSEEHRKAEEMIRRGLLARGPHGVGYSLPGKLFGKEDYGVVPSDADEG